MILLIDNYDSFTFNLYQYIGTFTQDIKVVRNDKITINTFFSFPNVYQFFFFHRNYSYFEYFCFVHQL